MSELEHIQLPSAESAYFVSNTPLYLLRKLREDPVVAALATSATGEELLYALRKAAREEPSSIAERVRPFVLLVALAMKDDIRRLREATTVQLPSANEWFDYIRRVLIETYRPTIHTTLKTPQLQLSRVSTSSSNPVQFKLV